MQYTNMHFSTTEQFGMVFSRNINNLQSWTKMLRQKRKSIFQWKNPSPPQISVVGKAFDKKTSPNSTLILEGKGKNLEFEKLSHFLNLLDFQVFLTSFVRVCSRKLLKSRYQVWPVTVV